MYSFWRPTTVPALLPTGFIWSSCSLEETHAFLDRHYIRNDTFTLAYTPETLKWAVNDHIAIRKENGNELVGYISSTYLDVSIESQTVKMAQINFLCVHDSHRNEGFAPLLISEIKKRSNADGIGQAVFTAASELPMVSPITQADYWHRFIDVRKLVRTGFFKTNRLREKYYEINGPCVCAWRKMVESDIPKVTRILQEHVKGFKIAPVITELYVRRWILPIHAFVDDTSDQFVSFYSIPYRRTNGTVTVNQAYRFFIVGPILNDAFILAKNLGFDVFNTLSIGLDIETLESMKCIKGTGHVFYYLFNRTLDKPIIHTDIALVIP